MPQAKPKKVSVAVLGYGSQGKAVALNLRDSGYHVTIGLKSRSRSAKAARRDGFCRIVPVGKAVAEAGIVCFALPDHLHQRIYKRDIEKNLHSKSILWFLHGFSVHFGLVNPPAQCDVILIAPHGPGIAVRQKFLGDRSLSAFYAIHQDYSGAAKRNIFALSAAMGFRRSRLVKTTFEREAVGDLFGEQAVLCGGLSELVVNGFEVLVEKGLPPENAYLEVAYQLDLIIDLIKNYGIEGMYDRISVTARYGSVMSGDKVVDKSVKKRMLQLYDDIESGKFAHRLNRLTARDIAGLRQRIRRRVPGSFEKAAKKYSK